MVKNTEVNIGMIQADPQKKKQKKNEVTGSSAPVMDKEDNLKGSSDETLI